MLLCCVHKLAYSLNQKIKHENNQQFGISVMFIISGSYYHLQ